MRLYFRYMVSLKCRVALQRRLNELEIPFYFEEPGIVDLYEELDEQRYLQITNELNRAGVPLLDHSDRQLFEKTLSIIDNLILDKHEDTLRDHEALISEETKTDFEYLSDLFVQVKGISMEYFIRQEKTERAKELLTYTDKTSQEVANDLHYESAEALTAELKEYTGLSPDFFIKIRKKRNKLNSPIVQPNLNTDEAIHQAHGKSQVQGSRTGEV